VLRTLQVMAPFTPFLTEHMYQNLRRCHAADSSGKSDSVHFCDIPAATQESQVDTHIQQVTADCITQMMSAQTGITMYLNTTYARQAVNKVASC
jgi:isoleucyl-tRNA synthetase